MADERRDNQNLTLNTGSCLTRCGQKHKQTREKSGRLDGSPNRWLRIGFAAQNKECIFNNLLTHINVVTLREAFNAIDGSKALGIDGISKHDYNQNLQANLKDLENRVHKGSYKPQTKREVLIPKANGSMRHIAISCFEDKLVDSVVAKLLSTIYEPLFIRNSFGFRPYHSTHQAVNATYQSLKDNRRPFVVEIDFANFFNTIPHRLLMKFLGKRISDNRFKGLIGRFIQNNTLDSSGNMFTPDIGTPQGSSMSPVLANVYLHEVVDAWFIQTFASYTSVMVRYADDAVFFFNKEISALTLIESLNKRVSNYGLTLNQDKTKVISFDKNGSNDFDFLGFTFYWGRKWASTKRILKLKTQKKTLHRAIQSFVNWIKGKRCTLKSQVLWNIAKSKLVGHYNYFGYALNLGKLNHFYWQVTKALFKWLNRRSQKRSFYWYQFYLKLHHNPLPKPPGMAHLKHFDRRSFYAF
jgi:group II intron reverse transcriptase/maturase